jgi:hypothetical protein
MGLDTEVWIWNLNDDYPGVNNDDSQLPIGRACLKTHESSRWFSAAQLAGYIDTYRQQGIEFSAWCVPTGLTDDAALAISVLNDMRAAGIAEPWLQMDVEVEPTQYFWKGTPAQLEGVFSRIRSACPWAKLILCTYQFDEATYGISRLIPYIDWIATMSYWNDFRTAPELRLQYEVSQLARHGKPIQFGLPGNVAAGEMTRALRWLDPRGGLEIPPIVWRRGTTTLETWNAIAAYQMQWQPPAPPKPEPDPVPPPPPDPTQPTVEQVQLGLIDKIVHQDYATAYADLGKIVGG